MYFVYVASSCILVCAKNNKADVMHIQSNIYRAKAAEEAAAAKKAAEEAEAKVSVLCHICNLSHLL